MTCATQLALLGGPRPGFLDRHVSLSLAADYGVQEVGRRTLHPRPDSLCLTEAQFSREGRYKPVAVNTNNSRGTGAGPVKGIWP